MEGMCLLNTCANKWMHVKADHGGDRQPGTTSLRLRRWRKCSLFSYRAPHAEDRRCRWTGERGKGDKKAWVIGSRVLGDLEDEHNGDVNDWTPHEERSSKAALLRMESNQHWHKQALGPNYLPSNCCKSRRGEGEAGSAVLESISAVLKALWEIKVSGHLKCWGYQLFNKCLSISYYVQIFCLVQKWIIWNSCPQASYGLYGVNIHI